MNGSAESIEMKQVSCPLCASREAKEIARDQVNGLSNVFIVVRCRKCSMAYVNPAPTEDAIAQYYRKSRIHARLGDDHQRHSPEFVVSLCDQRLKAVERLRGPGKLLDVGCGFGEFGAYARERGWQVFGTEVSPARLQVARRRLGEDHVLNVDLSGQYAALAALRPFDVITVFHVLEHVLEPVPFLRRLRELMSPAGWLIVDVPNLGCLRLRLGAGVMVNQLHLVHFEPRTLRAVLEKAGFGVLSIGGADNKGAAPSFIWRTLRRVRLGLEEGLWRMAGVHLGTNLRAIARPLQPPATSSNMRDHSVVYGVPKHDA